MYFPQRIAELQSHEALKNLNLPYKHLWKQVLIEPLLQTELGVNKGDTVLIRPHMMTPYPAACVVSGESPSLDHGRSIIRLHSTAYLRMKADVGSNVIVEKIDVIPASKITLQWFVRFIPRNHLNKKMKEQIIKNLKSIIFHDIQDLPIMVNDKFSTLLSFPDEPDKVYDLDYWIKEVIPRFPVVKLNSKSNFNLI
jgi:hypothetical protein